MNREEITFMDLIKHIESGKGKEIRLYSFELAGIFNVCDRTIRAHVKAIIKGRIIRPSITSEVIQDGNIFIPDTHDLEMIIALAFRIDSPQAADLREWIVKKLSFSVEKELSAFTLNNPVTLN